MTKLFGWRAVLMLFFGLWVGFVLWWYIFHLPAIYAKKETREEVKTEIFDAVNKQNKIKLKEKLDEGYIDSCDVNCTHGM